MRSAATQAPPSGAMKIPSAAAASLTPCTISASETATAAPRLCRRSRRIRKSAKGLGTRRPWAWVAAPSKNSASSLPSANAFTIGAQPSACTANIRGRLGPTKPIASISSKAFHMPMRPVPPPVG